MLSAESILKWEHSILEREAVARRMGVPSVTSAEKFYTRRVPVSMTCLT